MVERTKYMRTQRGTRCVLLAPEVRGGHINVSGGDHTTCPVEVVLPSSDPNSDLRMRREERTVLMMQRRIRRSSSTAGDEF